MLNGMVCDMNLKAKGKQLDYGKGGEERKRERREERRRERKEEGGPRYRCVCMCVRMCCIVATSMKRQRLSKVGRGSFAQGQRGGGGGKKSDDQQSERL